MILLFPQTLTFLGMANHISFGSQPSMQYLTIWALLLVNVNIILLLKMENNRNIPFTEQPVTSHLCKKNLLHFVSVLSCSTTDADKRWRRGRWGSSVSHVRCSFPSTWGVQEYGLLDSLLEAFSPSLNLSTVGSSFHPQFMDSQLNRNANLRNTAVTQEHNDFFCQALWITCK